MSLPKSTSYQNGQTPASPKLGEAFVSTDHMSTTANGPDLISTDHGSDNSVPIAEVRAQQRTVFPMDQPSASLRTVCYGLTHHYFGGITLFRWLVILLVIVTVAILIAGPFPWMVTTTCGIIAAAVLLLWRGIEQRRDFVRFDAGPPPASAPPNNTAERLNPTDKIPVHVTGRFTVEGREERFTWVSGFYRTFATREHALLCQVQHQRFWLVAESDGETEGMWYIFFQPEDIVALRWGTLLFGSQPREAIAIDHKIEIKAEGRFKRDKTIVETVFLTFQDREVGQRLWEDLQADLLPTEDIG